MPRCIRRALTKLAAVVVLVVAVLAVAKFGLPGLPFGPSTTDRSHAPILHEVTKLERLTAAEGRFSVVVDVETGTEGVPAALAGERATMVAAGTVPAVVDLGQLTAAAVTVDGDRVTMHLPAPTLGPVVIDHEQTRVTGRERGLLTRLGDAVESQPVDDQPLYALAAERIETAAADSDLLSDARESAGATLTELGKRLGYNSVTIEFDEAPATDSPTRKANP
jgi:hypothetical protein